MSFIQQLRTVLIFTKLSTRRFFRDRLAQFFGVLFPLIFLFVFGSLNNGGNKATFSVVLLNQSRAPFAAQFESQLSHNRTFKIDKSVKTMADAQAKMSKSQIDGIIILEPGFGETKAGQQKPTGQIKVLYN